MNVLHVSSIPTRDTAVTQIGPPVTHILHMDFVKRPEKRSAVRACFTASTVLLCTASRPTKMWVKDRAQVEGLSGSSVVKALEACYNYVGHN